MILNLLPINNGEASIADATISIASIYYTGSQLDLSDWITVTYGGATLVEGRDYALGGETSGTSPGTYTAIIVGMGSFSGTKVFSWSILKMSENARKIEISTSNTFANSTVINYPSQSTTYNFPNVGTGLHWVYARVTPYSTPATNASYGQNTPTNAEYKGYQSASVYNGLCTYGLYYDYKSASANVVMQFKWEDATHAGVVKIRAKAGS